ncbi:protein capL (plasmid) [Legionella adelaidensis]|uniref:Protein capL n=1 Tax=Legionella adelaidensis TaxID=45056 RepID=A0A0W0R5L3_9GAMM|nr:nucleotide sugar dehydrogenase [Legionella adelaidensis]KTC66313.1 protein capL [Legionella adelaidensis]VEH84909.1 protein capL [Legionella adelaidensis]
MKPEIAIIGVGYVGLELVLAFAKAKVKVYGYDIDENRIRSLRATKKNAFLLFTHSKEDIKNVNYFIIAVPTTLNDHHIPDLLPIKNASRLIGSLLKKGDTVIIESSLFPGATEEIVIPLLEEGSGLKSGEDFFVGFSPERLDPGSSHSSLENSVKVYAGQNDIAAKKIEELYQKLPIKLYKVSSLKSAEACKLIENIQRDVNIALMNEYAMLLNKMGIPSSEVFNAAATKWNFLSYKPGLVGGYCIPINPYYLLYQANKYGIDANLIRTARQVNENFIYFILHVLLKLLNNSHLSLKQSKVAILGLSYKPDISETRFSLALSLYYLLVDYGFTVFPIDPCVDKHSLPFELCTIDSIPSCDAILVLQEHAVFKEWGIEKITKKLNYSGIFMDIPGIFINGKKYREFCYWSL